MFETTMSRFKVIAKVEGYSFLILLFIAMPMKYMMGIAIATKIVGMIHGGLFLWFLFALYEAASEHKWNFKFISLSFILSLVPFGTFYLGKRLDAMDEI